MRAPNLRFLLLRCDIAGRAPASAISFPMLVVRNAPVMSRAHVLIISIWMHSATFVFPFHQSSDPYRVEAMTTADCSFQQLAGVSPAVSMRRRTL